jgi:hypothetical protein
MSFNYADIEERGEESSPNSSEDQVYVNPDVRTEVVTLQDCSDVYFSGYLVRRLLERFSCPKCEELFLGKEDLSDKSQLLILYKAFPGMKNTSSGLHYPSSDFFAVTKAALKVFKRHFPKILCNQNVKKLIAKLERKLQDKLEGHPDASFPLECKSHIFYAFGVLFTCLIKKL